jgi:hypothetical protein
MTAPRYRSISEISNRVTAVTLQRCAGSRSSFYCALLAPPSMTSVRASFDKNSRSKLAVSPPLDTYCGARNSHGCGWQG